MKFSTGKVNIHRAAAAASEVYAALLLTVFFVAVPRGGYGVIADFKYRLFFTLSVGYIAVMAALGMAHLMTGGKISFKWLKNPACIIAAAYLAFCCVSAAASPYGWRTLTGGTRHDGLLTAAIYVVTFLLLSRILRPKRYMLWLLAGSTAVCCAVAMVQLAGGNPLGLYPEGTDFFGANSDYAGEFVGTFGNVDMGMAVLAGAALAMAAGLVRRTSKWEWLMLVPLAADVYVIFRVGVWSAILALAVGTVIALPALSKNKKAAFAVSGGIAAAVLAILWFGKFDGGMLFEAAETLHGRAEPGFGSGRIYIWREALKAFSEQPLFGTGPDTFRFLGLDFTQVRDGVEEVHAVTAAHNEYLNVLVCDGCFAAACFTALPALLCIRWYRGRCDAPCAGAFAAAYSVAMFFGIAMPLNAPFWWLALAMMNADTGKST